MQRQSCEQAAIQIQRSKEDGAIDNETKVVCGKAEVSWRSPETDPPFLAVKHVMTRGYKETDKEIKNETINQRQKKTDHF